MRRNLHVAVLLACFCIAGNVPAQPTSNQARANVPSGTRAASEPVRWDLDIIRNSIAGPLIDALSGQLGGRAIEMRLDAIDVRTINASDGVVDGAGGVQVQGRNGWIGFQFSLLYDSRLRRASQLDVRIDRIAAGEHDVPNDPRVVQQLEAVMIAALAHEFRKPSTWLHLDRIATVEGSGQRLRINAEGIAYLGREGPGTPISIEALYDRSSDSWPKLVYVLANEPVR